MGESTVICIPSANDHDQLRHDPVLATLAGKLTAKRRACAPLAGKSTLNRLEHSPARPDRYHKIGHDAAAIEGLFVTLFLEAHKVPPQQIILDLDATDDPLHGHQEGRFFHGYYDGYCYLPLYVFGGRHLLAAKLRRSNIDASAGAVAEVERIVTQIRACWPRVKIILRADSGFAREELMAWSEAHGVDYLFGLARNQRLVDAIGQELAEAAAESLAQGGPARRFADFPWRTLDSWSRRRRVVAKAEHLPQGSNPRFVVTSLSAAEIDARALYEDVYCARGEVERTLLTSREFLVNKVRDHENEVRGALRPFGLKVGRVGARAFAPRVRELVAERPHLALCMEALLTTREALVNQLAALHAVLLRTVKNDELCTRFMGIPGVGPVTALAFKTTIDRPDRFRRSADVGAHLGLAPRQFQSGETDRRGRIAKTGDAFTRTALFAAANVMLSRSTQWTALKHWGITLAKRSSLKKAKVAVARKLAVIMHRMWRDGTPFRWTAQEA